MMKTVSDSASGSVGASRGSGAGLLTAACVLLDQCERILDLVGDAGYVRPSDLLRGGTIGKHLRHTLDHYGAIAASRPEGEPIDYDHRARGVPIESDRSAARASIRAVRHSLATLAGAGETAVRIRVMLSASGEEAVLDSTLAREIAFATHHGVHHVAMMRAIAGEFGVALDEEIGVAPSTINHERHRG